MTPIPDKPFDAFGLTWKWCIGYFWWAPIRDSHVLVKQPRKRDRWRSTDGRQHDTADEAIAWSVRTCPGASCRSCKHFDVNGERRGEVVTDYCCDRSRDTPSDGWCHRWEYKAT